MDDTLFTAEDKWNALFSFYDSEHHNNALLSFQVYLRGIFTLKVAPYSSCLEEYCWFGMNFLNSFCVLELQIAQSEKVTIWRVQIS